MLPPTEIFSKRRKIYIHIRCWRETRVILIHKRAKNRYNDHMKTGLYKRLKRKNYQIFLIFQCISSKGCIQVSCLWRHSLLEKKKNFKTSKSVALFYDSPEQKIDSSVYHFLPDVLFGSWTHCFNKPSPDVSVEASAILCSIFIPM